MEQILIFDGSFDFRHLRYPDKDVRGVHLDLFPLTSDTNLTRELMDFLSSAGCSDYQEMNSPELVRREVERIKQGVCKWSAEIGEHRIWNKSIKEWFLTPKKEVSTWWFSLLSEKNTYKTNVFLKMAQVQALDRIIKQKTYHTCWIAIGDKQLRKAVRHLGIRHHLVVNGLCIKPKNDFSRKERLEKYLKENGILGDLTYGLGILFRLIFRAVIAKLTLAPINKRDPGEKQILVVSYFPAVDIPAAEKGTFVNKYSIPIQNKLKKLKINVAWLLMYVPIGGYSYYDGLRLMKRFSGHGESLFLLEEFLTFRALSYSTISWIIQILKFIILHVKIGHDKYGFNLIVPEALPVLLPVWRQSFIGKTGVQGIVFFEMYKEVFRVFNASRYAIYYAEMHAWEKALNAAKTIHAPDMTSVGFQHVAVSQNFFHYFYDPSETVRNNKPTDLPLPDFLAGNGELMYSFLKRSNYPNLIQLEAIRQLYLNDSMKGAPLHRKRRILLVAGSTDNAETANMVRLIHSAFAGTETVEIWFKSHPRVPFQAVFNELEINAESREYVICDDDLTAALKQSTAVIVPSSTVAIEALAFGCEVIVPVFSNSMVMNPLADFDGYYHMVSSTDELEETVNRILSGYRLQTIDVYRSFVNKYWLLDPELGRWTNLLLSGNNL